MKFTINKALRKNQTPAETELWDLLRNKKLKGLKFRRQHKIGNYVADFCCLGKKLVIELDGRHHEEEKYKIQDEKKQRFIENQGYKVLRFWNDEIEDNFENVIDKILKNVGLNNNFLP